VAATKGRVLMFGVVLVPALNCVLFACHGTLPRASMPLYPGPTSISVRCESVATFAQPRSFVGGHVAGLSPSKRVEHGRIRTGDPSAS